MSDTRKKVSDDYFDSQSPPKKKSRPSIEFEDGSDDSEEEASTIPIMFDDSIISDDSEETSPVEFTPDPIVENRKKHPDLNDKRLRTFVRSLFHEKVFSLTLKQLGIPSGELCDIQKNFQNETLEGAERVLEEIQALLDTTGSERDGKLLLRLSYDFYSLIPTVSPVPTYIANKTELYNKFQTLHFLKQMKSSLDHQGDLTKQYESLQCKLAALDRTSETYKLILQTIGGTNYPRVPCIVKDIFKVEQAKEEEFESIEPRKMLWHGKVMGLLPSVLQDSLQLPKVPNPQLPCGNAIYFSEMFAESLQQAKSFSIEEFTDCVVLLCEVSVGQASCIRHKESFSDSPDGMNSVKCVGRSYPDPRDILKGPNGAELIAGKLIHNGVYGTEWEYNKYAIFNPKQIRIRFVCHIELTANDNATKNALPQHLPFGKIVSRGIWKYASGKKWTEYENEISETIEDNYQRNQKVFHVVIAGNNYTINFDHMIQYQTLNPKKSRKIRRE